MVTIVDDVGSMLERVVEKENICTITQQDGIGFKVMKTTFVPFEGLFIGLAKPEDGDFKAGETLGVSFRIGHKKCFFNGSVEQVNSNTIKLTRPETIHSVRRDLFHRAVVPYTVNTYLNVGSKCYKCRVSDLSVGGTLLITREDASALEVDKQAQVSMVFNRRQSINSVDGIIMGVEHRNDEYYISIQFVGLEFSQENMRRLGALAAKVRDVSRYLRQEKYESVSETE